jgi:hypothetical protein
MQIASFLQDFGKMQESPTMGEGYRIPGAEIRSTGYILSFAERT